MTPDSPAVPPATPVVQMRDISISFPGVKALDGVDFRLLPGEVHALMGENGAGKSTLIKALTGVYDIDVGSITVAGRAAPLHRSTAGAGRRDQHGLPGSQPLHQSDRRGEHPAGTRAAPIRPHRLPRVEPQGHRTFGAARTRYRPPLHTRSAPDRHPATGRHRARDGRLGAGACARRTDVEPGRRRGRRTVQGDPAAARRGDGDAVRFALPRPGVRDLRSDDGAAQRSSGRRVPHRRTRPPSTDRGDARPGNSNCSKRSRTPPRAQTATTPTRPIVRAVGRRPQAADPTDHDRRLLRRSRRPGRAAGFWPNGTRPVALRRRPHDQRSFRHRRQAGATAFSARRDRQEVRVHVGGPQGRGHHRRPQRPRQPGAGTPGPARLRPAAVKAHEDRTRAALHGRSSTSAHATPMS